MDLDDIGEILAIIESDAVQDALIALGIIAPASGVTESILNTLPNSIEKISGIQKQQQENLEKLQELITSLEKVQKEEATDDDRKRIKEDFNKYFYEISRRLEIKANKPFKEVSINDIKRIDSEILPRRFQRSIIMRSVFFAIEKYIKRGSIENFSHYTIDIPMEFEREQKFIRLVRKIDSNKIQLYLLKEGKSYENEPMFPRLFIKESNSFKEKELPKAIRQQAFQNMLQWIENKMNPFSERQLEILSLCVAAYTEKGLYRENNKLAINITSAEIAAKVFLQKDSVSEHMRNIGKLVTRIFNIVIHPSKNFAYYWHEMGLLFP